MKALTYLIGAAVITYLLGYPGWTTWLVVTAIAVCHFGE